MEELETVFGCPVIEAYGMTEAAHQMASNRFAAGPAQGRDRGGGGRAGGCHHDAGGHTSARGRRPARW